MKNSSAKLESSNYINFSTHYCQSHQGITILIFESLQHLIVTSIILFPLLIVHSYTNYFFLVSFSIGLEKHAFLFFAIGTVDHSKVKVDW